MRHKMHLAGMLSVVALVLSRGAARADEYLPRLLRMGGIDFDVDPVGDFWSAGIVLVRDAEGTGESWLQPLAYGRPKVVFASGQRKDALDDDWRLDRKVFDGEGAVGLEIPVFDLSRDEERKRKLLAAMDEYDRKRLAGSHVVPLPEQSLWIRLQRMEYAPFGHVIAASRVVFEPESTQTLVRLELPPEVCRAIARYSGENRFGLCLSSSHPNEFEGEEDVAGCTARAARMMGSGDERFYVTGVAAEAGKALLRAAILNRALGAWWKESLDPDWANDTIVSPVLEGALGEAQPRELGAQRWVDILANARVVAHGDRDSLRRFSKLDPARQRSMIRSAILDQTPASLHEPRADRHTSTEYFYLSEFALFTDRYAPDATVDGWWYSLSNEGREAAITELQQALLRASRALEGKGPALAYVDVGQLAERVAAWRPHQLAEGRYLVQHAVVFAEAE